MARLDEQEVARHAVLLGAVGHQVADAPLDDALAMGQRRVTILLPSQTGT